MTSPRRSKGAVPTAAPRACRDSGKECYAGTRHQGPRVSARPLRALRPRLSAREEGDTLGSGSRCPPPPPHPLSFPGIQHHTPPRRPAHASARGMEGDTA